MTYAAHPYGEAQSEQPHGCAQRSQQRFTPSLLTKSKEEAKVTRYLRKAPKIENGGKNKKTKYNFFP